MVEEVFFPPPKPIFGKVQSQKKDKQLNILVMEGPLRGGSSPLYSVYRPDVLLVLALLYY